MKLNIVPASTGIQWVRLGIKTFLRQPLALCGLFFMYMVAVLLIGSIPFVGTILGGMLVPAATLGLIVASAQASEGRFPMPSVLLSAFRAGRQRARAMLILGAIYALCSMVATLLATLIVGTPPAAEINRVDNTTLLALAFHSPLFLMFWHAPALVHWHGVSPTKSLFFSVVACLRNILPLFVYTAAWMGVFLAAALFFGLIGAVIGGEAASRAVMFPVALLMAAMFSTSIYFTFRDSFLAEPAPEGDTHPPDAES